MKQSFLAASLAAALLVPACQREAPSPGPIASVASPTNAAPAGAQFHQGKGVVVSLEQGGRTVRIKHEEIPDYMPAMTMPFPVQDAKELAGLKPGDEVTFRIVTTEANGWIDQVKKTGHQEAAPAESAETPSIAMLHLGELLPDYTLTNEFGQAFQLSQYRGQALAFTFFFTRCPFPEYCPRLMKNFAGASRQMAASTSRPTNWHFLSISFDTAFDTPQILRGYALGYNYDSNRWTFATGSPRTIAQLAVSLGLEYKPFENSFQHSFCTVVLDGQGRIQTKWPMGGDFADDIVEEVTKAAATK